jgi:hypothetical protein
MRPQTFEISIKYGFSQITFFRKVRETEIYSESFCVRDASLTLKFCPLESPTTYPEMVNHVKNG